MPFEDLSRGERAALVAGLSIVAVVFGSSFYASYLSHVEYVIEFEVFEAFTAYYSGLGMNQTIVLTNGTGKLGFIGTWWDTFEEGHSYRVTYVRKPSGRRYTHLIILDWEEIL